MATRRAPGPVRPESIGACAGDPSAPHATLPHWRNLPRLVDAAARATGALGGSMWRIDQRAALDDIDYSTLNNSHPLDDYRKRFSHLNPVLPRAMAVMRPGDVACGDDFVPVAEYQRTFFYNECVRQQGYLFELGALLEARSDYSAMLFVARSPRQRAFSADERATLREATPHIRAALAIARHVQAGQQAELARQVMAGRGWGALKASGALLFLQGPLTERLRLAGALAIADGRLQWTDAVLHAHYEHTVAILRHQPSAGPRTLAIRTDTVDVDCEVVPIADARLLGLVGATIVLLFREPEDSGRALRERFALTRQETLVAAAITRGATLRSIAMQLGIRYETVRTHAKRIYAKAGARSRAEFTTLARGP